MSAREMLARLSQLDPAGAPVVTMYLDTRWTDEHQRLRVRVFVKTEVARARAGASADVGADLDWIEARAASVLDQTWARGARGVALFACGGRGVREALAVREPFDNALVVADRAMLRPLADTLQRSPEALVGFVDGRSARLIPLGAGGVGDELTLESDVGGRHRRGGWALLAESRYRRHLANQRDRHFDAVAAALGQLIAEDGVHRIVLAGEPRTVVDVRGRLPQALAARVAGEVRASRDEAAGVIAARGASLLAEVEHAAEAVAVDEALAEAAKGGQAVAGLGATLAAVAAGAVRRLDIVKAFRETGGVCPHCSVMQPGLAGRCAFCGMETTPVELGEAMAERVVQTGGVVETVPDHARLAACGGVAALVRYRF